MTSMVQYGWSFWTLPKHNQKRLLEDELRTFLHEHENLSPCERYLLAETIVHVYAGRYGLGRESMDDVHESPAPSVGCCEKISKAARSISHQKLVRARRYLEGAPVQQIPVFR